ncbi:MAG: glycerol-3-phosphate 1-O-acyltransferase PlsY [Lentisphaeria bacterium]|nr:glycerol-3-phosphate 1-O-acyltransferase PlsY [Lentisphaeria bacterium]NQZ69877.1 glycerol-3-phosphate 1-O-acyltransferase PlsY [Lentisphaeria bacterium]
MGPNSYYSLIGITAYLLGGIPFGWIIGKAHGFDVRDKGSGNIGATNVGRTCGKRWGIICFLLDAAKGYLPVFFLAKYAATYEANTEMALILAALATVLGHVFCPYLKFKGGKGVATSAGAILAVAPYSVLLAFICWGLVLAIFKYVGLASVVAAITLPFSALLMNHYVPKSAVGRPILIMLFVLAALAVYRHKSNLKRLLDGSEPKIGSKKKEV